jgi:large subunit ribosomal protein L10
MVVNNFSMTREEKSIVEDLTAQSWYKYVYVADISGLNADTTSKLRRACYKAGIKLEVIKKYFTCKWSFR